MQSSEELLGIAAGPSTAAKKAQQPAPDSQAQNGAASGKKPEAQASDESFVQLSNNRRASVSEYKGNKMLNLREYYEKDGQVCSLLDMCSWSK